MWSWFNRFTTLLGCFSWFPHFSAAEFSHEGEVSHWAIFLRSFDSATNWWPFFRDFLKNSRRFPGDINSASQREFWGDFAVRFWTLATMKLPTITMTTRTRNWLFEKMMLEHGFWLWWTWKDDPSTARILSRVDDTKLCGFLRLRILEPALERSRE